MTRVWQPRMMAATAVLALGLATGLIGCVAYEPAPAYYYGPPAYYTPGYYYAPGYAYGTSFNFFYRDGGRRHWR
jgi:hypothetical protein